MGVILLLTSCKAINIENNSKSITSSNSDNLYESNNSIEEPPIYYPEEFKTIEELKRSFFAICSEEKIKEIEEDENNNNKGVFRAFIYSRTTDNKLNVPFYKGAPITLRNKEGLPIISVFPYEKYNKPWIWYQCTEKNTDFIIKTMYIDDSVILNEISSHDISWSINRIWPGAPNVNNYSDYPIFKKIYIKEYELNDRKVSALVTEFNDDPRLYVEFIYDDMLVSIQSKPELLTPEFMADLSFASVSLSPKE
ncbi:hypothetical protein SDC9_53207 [bioreactor metagenome]|uniref:Uncharacterized protein n=1 Tax=bioreactor metagenome TaxID=1076179 RepID=A0A644WXY9_9ZZZZ|nr:hypothetical protein [Oscillospiraceae bacterium]